MKKLLTLAVLMVTMSCFSQEKKSVQYPIYPGCEKYDTKIDRLKCLNFYVTNFTKTYFDTYSNVLDYFQYPSMSEVANFQINTKGEFIFKESDKNSEAFNRAISDLFFTYNSYIAYNKLVIDPAKTDDGKPAVLNFNIPIVYNNSNPNFKNNPIRFTIKLDQTYVVRQDVNYDFVIYDSDLKEIRRVRKIQQFYQDPVLVTLMNQNKHLITSQKVNGKKIELFVHDLFKNQKENFKIEYFEDGKLIKEFDTMNKFLKSDYAKYIY